MAIRGVDLFEQALAAHGRSSGLFAGRWDGGAKRTANLLHLGTRPRPTVLYVKDSALNPAFWGLNVSQLDSMRASGANWWVVLLTGTTGAGYLLSSDLVDKATRTRRWSSAAKTGEWKVHEDHSSDLAGARKFYSLERALEMVTAESV